MVADLRGAGMINGAPVVGYLRVSTREQSESGAGLDAQRRSISDEALRRGWTVRWIEDRGESGKSMKRDGLQSALKLLKRREASCLVVAKLDRLSRSVHDFAGLLKLSQRGGWGVVALDLGVDTTTPTGRLVANVMMSVAEWEREVIAARTRDALAERKAAGVRLGRERVVDSGTVARIMCDVAEGWQPGAIARRLDMDEVPTPAGGRRWYVSTVSRIIASERRLTA
jgi:DNA invertase Pin-like site-specific DNA recombinase